LKVMARRLQKIETQAKQTLTTVNELIDFVLRAQSGKVSIHSAIIGVELLRLNSEKALIWQSIASKMATKHDRPLEEVQRDLIRRKPELARYFPSCD
jgi:hypothetical protein